jgi:probable addiction module antidote protein
MAAYLEACIEESDGDAGFIARALGDTARARGMTRVARDSGLSRESLYKALSGRRSPSLGTVLLVLRALGLTLHAAPAKRTVKSSGRSSLGAPAVNLRLPAGEMLAALADARGSGARFVRERPPRHPQR